MTLLTSDTPRRIGDQSSIDRVDDDIDRFLKQEGWRFRQWKIFQVQLRLMIAAMLWMPVVGLMISRSMWGSVFFAIAIFLTYTALEFACLKMIVRRKL